jgi:predicted GNAT family N-acyltransferase
MLTIEPLNPDKHVREGFDCGNDSLNYYLKRVARQHSERGVSRTFVLVDTDKPAIILGYYTLTICAVVIEEMPPEFAKKYGSATPLFAGKLGRLAVSKGCQGRGHGKFMVRNAMLQTVAASETYGLIAFFVDAKDDGLAEYYSREFGFHRCCNEKSNQLYIKIDTIRRAIKKGSEPR